MTITVRMRRGFTETERFLHNIMHRTGPNIFDILYKWGQIGADALARATPVHSGLAASSWSFKVSRKGTVYSIVWLNYDVENGFPVAIMLQYGYATGTGGWVQGIDYVNSTISPIFDQIAYEVWEAVTSG